MRQFALSIVLMICVVHLASAQRKTYIGAEASIFSDRTQIYDNGDWLRAAVMTDPMGGFTVRHEVDLNYFWEAGVMIKPYWRGYAFQSTFIPVLYVNYFSWLIPLRAGTTINLHRKKVFIVPVIGYTLGIQPRMQLRQNSGSRIFGGNSITFTDSEDPSVSRQFSLVQAGVGVKFKLFKTVIWSINTNYYKGFNKVSQLDVIYSANGSAPTTGTATSKGDFWCVGTGLVSYSCKIIHQSLSQNMSSRQLSPRGICFSLVRIPTNELQNEKYKTAVCACHWWYERHWI